MEVIIRPKAEQAIALVAELIVSRIVAKPDCVLGLATGRTMEHLYTRLVALVKERALTLRECRTFNLDEYIGLGSDDPGSYHHYMQDRFFSRTDLDPKNTHLLDGLAQSLRAEAARYEKCIEEMGGIDLQLLGIGAAGHIGFNEPLSAIMSRTRDKTLTPTTLEQNKEMFEGLADNVPKRALTMGVGTILEAREIILLATGPSKAGIVAKAVEGPVTAMISASALQLHPNCKVVLDDAAAQNLAGRAYYDFVFANEPEWAPFRA